MSVLRMKSIAFILFLILSASAQTTNQTSGVGMPDCSSRASCQATCKPGFIECAADGVWYCCADTVHCPFGSLHKCASNPHLLGNCACRATPAPTPTKTPVPVTPAPPTPVPDTPVPPTPVPPTPVPDTPAPPNPVPPTAPSTPAPPTPVPVTPAPTAATPTSEDVPRVLVDVVFVLFYVAFGTYAVVRVRRSNKSSTTNTNSAAMSRYFFCFLPIHCIARLQEIILRSKFFSINTGTLQLIFTAFPAVTFQIVLFLYLRVWQLQEYELTPYQANQNPVMGVRKVHVFLWSIGYFSAVALDFVLNKNGLEDNMYISYVYMNSNFIVISAAFFYLGNKMHQAVNRLYGANDVGTFESHILRIKWLFGVSCLVRAGLNVPGLMTLFFKLDPILQTNSIIFDATVFLIEVVPLAAAVLSMAIVERRLNAMHPGAFVQEQGPLPNPGYNPPSYLTGH